MRVSFVEVRPNNNLSVAVRPDGLVAWVKLINDVDLPDGVLIDKALLFEQHRMKVIADMAKPEWRTIEEL